MTTVSMPPDETALSGCVPSCRSCGSTNVTRSRTRWFEQWVKLLSMARPHRCRVCDWRGWF